MTHRRLVALLAAVLAWRLLLGGLLAGYLEASAHPMPPEGHYNYHEVERVGGRLGALLVAWDSYWFLNVVEYGWGQRHGTESNAPHLPVYPLLMRAGGWLGLSPAVAGVWISNLAFVALLALAFAWARERAGPEAATRLLVWLAVFPSGWVWHMVYSESLFCAGVFGFLWLHQRQRYAAAALLGLVLPLTRAAALALLVAAIAELALDRWRRRRIEPARWLPVLGLSAGALGLAAFSWSTTGSPVGFLAASAGWAINAEYADSWLPLLASVWDRSDEWAVWLALPLLAVYAVTAVVLVVRRPDLPALFSLAAMGMLLQVSYLSQLRYLLPLLPVHLALVQALARPAWFVPAAVALALTQLLVTLLMLTWQLVP